MHSATPPAIAEAVINERRVCRQMFRQARRRTTMSSA